MSQLAAPEVRFVSDRAKLVPLLFGLLFVVGALALEAGVQSARAAVSQTIYAGFDADGNIIASDGNIGPPVDPALTSRVVPFNDVDALERALADEQVALPGPRPEDGRRRHRASAEPAAGDPCPELCDRPHGVSGVLRHNPPMLRPVLPLETVPNFSEGRDPRTIDALGEALESAGARVLDVHVDVDHNRSVFTTCGSAGGLRQGLIAAATVAMERIDVRANTGVHPHIGALDIVPVVPLDDALHERFGRRFRHNEQSLRIAERLNLTEEVRNGILTHTGELEPATLEGKIVRIVDRVAYINHDIDDAIRYGILGEAELPRAEIELLGPTGAQRIDTLVQDIVEVSEAAGDIRQSDEIGEAMLSLRSFMFERVYLGEHARGEHARARRVIARIFEHLVARGDEPDAIVEFVAGMTDRFALHYAETLD
jgi:hypothetical protein